LRCSYSEFVSKYPISTPKISNLPYLLLRRGLRKFSIRNSIYPDPTGRGAGIIISTTDKKEEYLIE